jgi:hypothetical protein
MVRVSSETRLMLLLTTCSKAAIDCEEPMPHTTLR